jgi:hypothetical protein
MTLSIRCKNCCRHDLSVALTVRDSPVTVSFCSAATDNEAGPRIRPSFTLKLRDAEVGYTVALAPRSMSATASASFI